MKLKNLLFSLFVFVVLAEAVAAQSTTQVSRRCSGASPSPARAKVEVEKDGDVNILPCSGRSVFFGAPFTAGSVFFANASGAIAQDNASFFFNDTTNVLKLSNVGGASVDILQLVATNANYAPQLSWFHNTSTPAGRITGNFNGGLTLEIPSGSFFNVGTATVTPVTQTIGYSFEAGGTAFRINPTSTTTKGQLIKLFAAQTANAFEIQPSGSATPLMSVNASGIIAGANGAAVASAAAIQPTGNVFHITGVTTITSMTFTDIAAGACFTMIFDGILTVTDGANLKLAGNFITTADDSLSGCWDGTAFVETARAVN